MDKKAVAKMSGNFRRRFHNLRHQEKKKALPLLLKNLTEERGRGSRHRSRLSPAREDYSFKTDRTC